MWERRDLRKNASSLDIMEEEQVFENHEILSERDKRLRRTQEISPWLGNQKAKGPIERSPEASGKFSELGAGLENLRLL